MAILSTTAILSPPRSSPPSEDTPTPPRVAPARYLSAVWSHHLAIVGREDPRQVANTYAPTETKTISGQIQHMATLGIEVLRGEGATARAPRVNRADGGRTRGVSLVGGRVNVRNGDDPQHESVIASSGIAPQPLASHCAADSATRTRYCSFSASPHSGRHSSRVRSSAKVSATTSIGPTFWATSSR